MQDLAGAWTGERAPVRLHPRMTAARPPARSPGQVRVAARRPGTLVGGRRPYRPDRPRTFGVARVAVQTRTIVSPGTSTKSSSWVTTGTRSEMAVAAIQESLIGIRFCMSRSRTRRRAQASATDWSTGRGSKASASLNVASRRSRVSRSTAANTPRAQLADGDHGDGQLVG